MEMSILAASPHGGPTQVKRGWDMSTVKLQQAATPALIAQARCLFREYRDCIRIDEWFPDFERELDNLPVPYAPPPDACSWVASTGSRRGASLSSPPASRVPAR